jgi:hypothetical protein
LPVLIFCAKLGFTFVILANDVMFCVLIRGTWSYLTAVLCVDPDSNEINILIYIVCSYNEIATYSSFNSETCMKTQKKIKLAA